MLNLKFMICICVIAVELILVEFNGLFINHLESARYY